MDAAAASAQSHHVIADVGCGNVSSWLVRDCLSKVKAEALVNSTDALLNPDVINVRNIFAK